MDLGRHKTQIFKNLDHLDSVIREPRLFIDEFFDRLRNKIDVYVEESLTKLNPEDDYDAAIIVETNKRRTDMIDELNHHTKRLLDGIKDRQLTNNILKCNLLRQEYNDAFENAESANDHLEQVYDRLEDEITEEVRTVEREIMDNQSFIFIKKLGKDLDMGYLLRISGFYVRYFELFERLDEYPFIRGEYLDMNGFKNNHTEIFLSESFHRYVTLNSSVNKFQSIFKIDASAQNNKLKESANYDLRLTNNPEGLTSLNLSNIRSRRLDLEIFEYLAELKFLSIGNNEFINFYEGGFAKLKELEVLIMVNTFSVDTAFNIGFLSSMNQLRILDISLPKEIDGLNMFSQLTHLEHLALFGTAARDVNIKRTKLTKSSMDTLSSLSSLKSLSLAFLEIEQLSDYHFSRLKKLLILQIRNSEISCLDHESFDRLPVRFVDFFFVNNQVNFGSEHFSIGKKQSQEEGINLSSPDEAPLHNASTIDMSSSHLKHIGKETFDMSLNVAKLDLNKSLIESIMPFALSNLSALKYLNLSRCKLKSINNLMFDGLVSLETLDLSKNEIESIELHVESNQPMSLAGRANLSEDEIRLVQKNLLGSSQNIYTLNLSDNKLQKLDLNIFYHLSNLARLDLSNNRIEEINEKAVGPGINSICKIDLSGNKIKFFSIESLGKAYKLNVLDLSQNMLESLNLSMLSNLPCLSTLNLGKNQLDITIDSGSTINKLVELNLSNNKLIEISNSALTHLVGLKKLAVDNCAIDLSLVLNELVNLDSLTVTRSKFDVYQQIANFEKKSFPKIQLLDLSFNSIRTLDDLDVHKLFPNLSRLILASCQVTVFKAPWVRNLKLLRDLDLSSNFMEEFIVIESKSLSFLKLGSNKIKELARSSLANLPGLRKIHLEKNQLSELNDTSVFADLPHLSEVNLSGNSIRRIDIASTFANNKVLTSLDLSDNILDNESINSWSFKNTLLQIKLVRLNFANNKLKDMPFIRNLVSLEELNLSSNEIESIHDAQNNNLFGRLFKLKRIDLSSNRIKMIRDDAFGHLTPTLEFVKL